MNKKLQQRIVGSIAVIGLLILVLPHLFSTNEYKLPEKPANNPTNNSTSNPNNFDDFPSTGISVEPIPSISSNNANHDESDPISENIWNNVTDNTPPNINAPMIPNTNSDSSIAEQLLAEMNTPTSTQSKTSSNQLPKIELIGSTQSKASTPTTNNQAKAATSQPKFTWYVQVGSYSSKENANKIMQDYRKNGYSAEVAYLSGQYKVRLGPLKTQENAKNVQTELKRHGINSYIIQIQ